MTTSKSTLSFVGEPHCHSFEVKGVTTDRMLKMRQGESLQSEPFTAFDRSWQIRVFLNGNDGSTDGRIVAALALVRSDAGVSVDLRFSVARRPFDAGITRFHAPDNPSGMGMEACLPTIKTREIIKKRKRMIPDAVLTVDVMIRLIDQGDAAPTTVVPIPESNTMGALRNIYEGRSYVPYDVVLVCEDQRFDAHVFVLVMRSRTFASIISPSFAQPSDCSCRRPLVKEIQMQEGIDARTTQRMLEFMYTDEIDIENVEEASHLLNAADFYQIDRLHEMCQNVIADNLTIDNAAEMLTAAEFHSADLLKKAIIKFVVRNIASVSCTAGYLSMARAWPHLAAELVHMVATGTMPPNAAV